MSGRAIFFDEDAARAVAARLVTDGFGADVARERFAGEDDDEEHPWAVITDAPDLVVELLVETFDGWMEYDDAPPATPPYPLPTQPIRVKNPDDD
jgi:hypothetical protein